MAERSGDRDFTIGAGIEGQLHFTPIKEMGLGLSFYGNLSTC
jgi:hypothetical protein